MQMTTIGVARSLSDLDKDYQDAVSSVTEVLFEDDFEIATRENATREKKRAQRKSRLSRRWRRTAY